MLVYRAFGSLMVDSILTTEKPDDIDKPCGYIERFEGKQVYRPFGEPTNKEVYLNPFTNRWV